MPGASQQRSFCFSVDRKTRLSSNEVGYVIGVCGATVIRHQTEQVPDTAVPTQQKACWQLIGDWLGQGRCVV